MYKIIDAPGVGKQLEIFFNNNQIYTISDLIFKYPQKYQSFKEDSLLLAVDKTDVTTTGILVDLPKIVSHRGNLKSLQFKMLVDNELIKVIAYRREYLKDNMLENMILTVKGRFEKKKKLITAQAVILKKLEYELKPIYNLEGIYDTTVNKIVKKILDNKLFIVSENLPNQLIKKHNLLDKFEMIKTLHMPLNDEALINALKRLKYEEALHFQYKMMHQKVNHELIFKTPKQYDLKAVKAFISDIPFELTKDQKEAVNDIFRDFKKNYPARRLIQGDVGSGKTIVVGIGVMGSKSSGYQSALMAPTEILAQQHYQFFKTTFQNLNICLLTSATKNKKEIKEKITSGYYDFVIGTHALAIDDVIFKNLGFVIIDEQHKFGVETRNTLKDKGNADVVYLTATPIPRTLALVLFGDMEVSSIIEKPVGRKDIITRYFSEDQLGSVFQHVKKELDKGNKAYFVAPSIEAEDRGQTVYTLFDEVQAAFNNYEVIMLHGRMSALEKQQAMSDFNEIKSAILVSTTVVEVGLDVKEATVMVITGAKYFGVSQLHQL
ncbi:MAG TPA: DEAD/DEAH box helicase, partial [Acholeplasma sp.]|nr:DEAD/DEAH box helicase [Acholeplasma sp.]